MAETTTRIIRPQAGFQEQFVKTNVDFCIGGGVVSSGKLLSVNELVLTPNGWKRNGDLQVGDYVNTPFGKPSRILGIYPHKQKEIFTLETSDGRKCDCGLEHLWEFRTRKQLQKYRTHKERRNFCVETTSQIIKRLERGEQLYIQIPDAQEFEEKEYVIPPYVLGVLIGDGCITDSTWNFNTAFCVSNNEQDVIEKTYAISGGIRLYKQPGCFTKKIYTPNAAAYKAYCEEVGINTYSYNKFIPNEYLFGSIAQRRELLAGLFDTDGTVSKDNCLRFSTTSKRLKDDFINLCRSLGYIATVSVDGRFDKYTTGAAYNISVHTDDIIFTSRKHLQRYNENVSKRTYAYKRTTDHVRIKSITHKTTEDALCIYVDHPDHLYIAGDWLTTHNTYAAVLAVAEPSSDPKFRGLFLRNNLGDLRAAGGALDTFKDIYGDSIEITEAGEPRVTFQSGAKIDVTHVFDQSRDKVLQRFKGRQYDFIYFDEGTGFTWECFSAIYTRNRGKAAWTGKVRMTTNPDYDHWLRTFLDWYIGADGFIREDRNGVVRYFYIAGETVKDVVWGDTKEEVYSKCKGQIDRVLAKVNGQDGKTDWKSLIKSFTFYLGRMSENKQMLSNNPDYAGSVAVMGGRNAQMLLEGNWNVSAKKDNNAPINFDKSVEVFENDEKRNGDKWITADLADTGTDNFVAIVWDGLHITDVIIKPKSTPRENAQTLINIAIEKDIADNHIIYDGIRGTYINDYIEHAQPFFSYKRPIGVHARMAYNLKDECYLRLCEIINTNGMSFDTEVGKQKYVHQNIKEFVTIQNEFIEECRVVNFRVTNSGKKTLYNKKEMNAKLGNSRSMDLLDPIAMRMMPLLEKQMGDELINTDVDDDFEANAHYANIYDDTFWN